MKPKEESDMEETVFMERGGTGYQTAMQGNKAQKEKQSGVSGEKLKLPIEIQDFTGVTRRGNRGAFEEGSNK